MKCEITYQTSLTRQQFRGSNLTDWLKACADDGYIKLDFTTCWDTIEGKWVRLLIVNTKDMRIESKGSQGTENVPKKRATQNKRITRLVRMEVSLHRELRQKALDEGRPLSRLLDELLEGARA